jgi:hypothetical protein
MVKAVDPASPTIRVASFRLSTTWLTKALKLSSSHSAVKLLDTTRIVVHVTRVLDGLAA